MTETEALTQYIEKGQDIVNPPETRSTSKIEQTTRMFNLILDCIPAYVSDKKRDQLQQLPAPILRARILAPRELYNEIGNERMPDIDPAVLERIPQDKHAAYGRGITLLNEIATETIRKDIVKNIAERYPVLKPVARLMEFYHNRIGLPGVIAKGRKEIKKQLSDPSRYNEVLTKLAETAISGNTEDHVTSLPGQEITIDELAIALGEKLNYGLPFEEQIQKKGGSRILDSLSVAYMPPHFPGNIDYFPLMSLAKLGVPIAGVVLGTFLTQFDADVGLMLKICGTIYGVSLSMATPEILNIGNILIHETSHYLTVGNDHIGLLPLSYKSVAQ